MNAQVNYHDVADILDPNYVPKTKEDILLFDEKQKYMYSILERILQIDEGKIIVCQHDGEESQRAQDIYRDFLAVMTSSTEAMMDSGTLLSYLTNARINDGVWPISCWKALSEEAQGIWDTMGDDDNKAKILALSEQHKAASHTTSSTVSVNLHDMATVCDLPPAELTKDIFLAVITKQHSNRASKPTKSPHGDVRFVMSQPVKSAIKAANAQVRDDKIEINRHMYVRQGQVHDIQYKSHRLLTRTTVPLLTVEQTEVSWVATPESLNNIHTGR